MNIKEMKKFKSIVQDVYCYSYYLNCKYTSILDIRLLPQGSIPVSTVVVYITTDECTIVAPVSVTILREYWNCNWIV
jgi:hypothetical protein